MIKTMNAPAILAALFVLVCIALIGTEGYAYYQAQQLTDPYPSRPEDKFNTDKDDLYPSQETGKRLLIHQSNTSELYASSDKEMNLEEFMEQETIIESPVAASTEDSFLLISGSYEDETFIISKQAQFERIGLNAEIIQLKGSDYWSLCIGRFSDRKEANSYSQKLKGEFDIKTFIYEKK